MVTREKTGSTRGMVEATLDQIFRREPHCHQAKDVPSPLLEIPPGITPTLNNSCVGLSSYHRSGLNVCQIQIIKFPPTHNKGEYQKHI